MDDCVRRHDTTFTRLDSDNLELDRMGLSMRHKVVSLPHRSPVIVEVWLQVRVKQVVRKTFGGALNRSDVHAPPVRRVFARLHPGDVAEADLEVLPYDFVQADYAIPSAVVSQDVAHCVLARTALNEDSVAAEQIQFIRFRPRQHDHRVVVYC